MGKLIDLTGKRFGRWTVLAMHPKRCHGHVRWLCRCDCGTERVVLGKDLRTGRSISCACSKRIDLVGKRFGRWKVIAPHPKRYWRGRAAGWVCRCSCGVERVVLGFSLRRGESTSCGCAQREMITKRVTTHGLSNSRVYCIWENMKQRCLNPNSPNYSYYGGRGITVPEEWCPFVNFFAVVGHAPPGKSLDRPDNDRSYGPGNWRWATPKQQRANQRPRKRRRAKLDDIRAYAASLARAASANGRARGAP